MDSSQKNSLRIVTFVFGLPILIFVLIGVPIMLHNQFGLSMPVVWLWTGGISIVIIAIMLFSLLKLRDKQH